MHGNLVERILDTSSFQDFLIEHKQQFFQFGVNLMIEVRFIDDVGAFCTLQFLDLSFDSVYFLYDVLDIDYIDLLFFFCCIFALNWSKHLLYLVSTGLLICFWFASLVLAHMIFLHLFYEFAVLRFRHFLISDAHVGVGGCNSSDGQIDKIIEIDLIFIYFEFFFFEEIQIE